MQSPTYTSAIRSRPGSNYCTLRWQTAAANLRLDQLKRELEQRQNLIQVGHQYSTRSILETELFLINAMNEGKGAVSPIIPVSHQLRGSVRISGKQSMIF